MEQLPRELTISIDDLFEDIDVVIVDAINDYLQDKFGCDTIDYNYDVQVKVKNINWDNQNN